MAQGGGYEVHQHHDLAGFIPFSWASIMARAAKAFPQISLASYTWNLERSTDEPICRASVEIQIWRTDLRTWTEGEGAGEMNGERE